MNDLFTSRILNISVCDKNTDLMMVEYNTPEICMFQVREGFYEML